MARQIKLVLTEAQAIALRYAIDNFHEDHENNGSLWASECRTLRRVDAKIQAARR